MSSSVNYLPLLESSVGLDYPECASKPEMLVGNKRQHTILHMQLQEMKCSAMVILLTLIK